jgi:hypothetical protein
VGAADEREQRFRPRPYQREQQRLEQQRYGPRAGTDGANIETPFTVAEPLWRERQGGGIESVAVHLCAADAGQRPDDGEVLRLQPGPGPAQSDPLQR